MGAAGGWSSPREVRVTSTQPASAERIVDYLASISWIAAMPDDARLELLAQVAELIRTGETPDQLPVRFVIGLTARS